MASDKKYTLKELKNKLTQKERIFCHEYIIDWNGSRSARKAGYSEKTCTVIAYENLTKPYIAQYIDFIKDDIAKEAQISKLSMISELKKIATSNIAEIQKDWITRKDFDSLSDEVKAAIQEINSSTRTIVGKEGVGIEIEYVKIKLYDKTKAIQDILKAMGWNEPEKMDLTSGGEIIQPNITVVSEDVREDLNKLYNADD